MIRTYTQLFAILVIFLCCFTLKTSVGAQGSAQKLGPESFNASGDAILTGNNCYQLTPAMDWSSGSLWYKEAISLSSPFEMELDLFLGCKNEDGADGMVFVFHPHARQTGYRGEGMGFAGLVPSLGIEIDTWQNFHLLDPGYDHLAVLRDGVINHDYSLAGPVRIPNLENCQTHKVKVSWSPSAQRLRISIDGTEYLSYKGDIVKNIFEGNPNVYWGVTAATGKYNNRQEICFEKLSFVKAEEKRFFDDATVRKLRKGEILALENIKFESGSTALTSDSYLELEKLYKFMEENPTLSLDVFGHTDSSGDAGVNQQISESRADAVIDYLLKRGVEKGRVKSRGFGESFPLASNGTSLGRQKNRRVEVYFYRHIP